MTRFVSRWQLHPEQFIYCKCLYLSPVVRLFSHQMLTPEVNQTGSAAGSAVERSRALIWVVEGDCAQPVRHRGTIGEAASHRKVHLRLNTVQNHVFMLMRLMSSDSVVGRMPVHLASSTFASCSEGFQAQ